MEKLLEKIQQHINQRQMKIEATTKMTIELMEEHLIQSAKVQMMIQAFMTTMARDIKTLTKNLASQEVSLKEFLYCRIISLNDQYKVWEAYIKDKKAWIRQSINSEFANNFFLFFLFPTIFSFVLISKLVNNDSQGEDEGFL